MSIRLSRRPNDVLQRIGAGSTRATVARILATFDRATASDVEAGARWYSDAATHLAALVTMGAPSMAHAAAVVSHLSPRTSWERNVAGAYLLVSGGAISGGVEDALALGCTAANVGRAASALCSDDPLSTFGPNAHKTRRFARNLLGDRRSVTVDVWAARTALGDTVEDPESALKRVGVYYAIEHAYTLAARRRGVDPTTMQATCWVVERGGRAS